MIIFLEVLDYWSVLHKVMRSVLYCIASYWYLWCNGPLVHTKDWFPNRWPWNLWTSWKSYNVVFVNWTFLTQFVIWTLTPTHPAVLALASHLNVHCFWLRQATSFWLTGNCCCLVPDTLAIFCEMVYFKLLIRWRTDVLYL